MSFPLGGTSSSSPNVAAVDTSSATVLPSSSYASQTVAASPYSFHREHATTSAFPQLPTVHSVPPASANNPLSDSLLLALRRSRPNTRLFRALFQYIPLRDSPNENPHLELPLQAGDYILVSGQMDEDQFYFGETLTGRKGLVPSNYVERIADHVLLQNAARAPSPSYFSCSCTPSTSNYCLVDEKSKVKTANASSQLNSLVCAQRPSSPSFALNVPLHHAQIVHDFTDIGSAMDGYSSSLPDSVCPYPPVDISKVTVQEIKHPDQPRMPFPRELAVEKKLSRSVVISWSPPEDPLIAISQYHICVDGVVKAVVPGTYKCKALIEDLNLENSVNISVRAVTENGHSPDSACTISVGSEAPVAPQHVRVTNITPISASVSWYPSNSNAEHVVLLNALKIGVCPPSVFQVQLQGLLPSTIYRVSVRTKHPKAVLEQRPVERCVDFKTLPKIGLPDPPSNVQVDVGPQPGTLLVSWKPVSNQPRPPSRAAIHSYLIYADGRVIAQVPAATADHVLLRLSDFADDPPIFVTVRTRTREGSISADSNVVRVPRNTSLSEELTHLPTSGTLYAAPISQQSYAGQMGIAVNTALPTMTPGVSSLPTNMSGGFIPTGYTQQPTTSVALNSTNYTPSATGLLTTAVPVHGMENAYPMNNINAAAMMNAVPTNMYNSVSGTLPNAAYMSNQTIPNMQTSYTAAQSNEMMPKQVHFNNGGTSGNSVATQNWRKPAAAQYYTFHPQSLFKEYASTEEKPSVLEMENNYLLKHQQKQMEREFTKWHATDSNPPSHYHTLNGRGAYVSTEAFSTLPRGLSAGVQGGRRFHRATPPRLTRVRSEEILGTRSEPDLRPPMDPDENCRWFVALYDYDLNMSPNANAPEEELPFRKHQLIKVYGEADMDGFYRGQVGRRFGLVPGNLIMEVVRDDLMPARQRQEAYPVEPAIRRMRWGSLKSRSYDNAGDRRYQLQRMQRPSAAELRQLPPVNAYGSLDRRDYSLPPRRLYEQDQYDNGNGAAVPSTSGRAGRDYSQPPLYAGREYGTRERDGSYPYDQHEARDSRDYGTRDSRDYGKLDREWYARRDRRDVGPADTRRGDTWGYASDHRDARDIREQPQVPPNRDRVDRTGQMPPQRERERMGGRYDIEDGMTTNDYAPTTAAHPRATNAPPREGGNRMEQDAAVGSTRAHWQTGNENGAPPGRIQQQPPQQQHHLTMSKYAHAHEQAMGGGWDDRSAAMNGDIPTRVMVAKYAYDPKQSPNVDAEAVELSFQQGDLIKIFGDVDDDGFFDGELNGVRGLVPSNFVAEITDHSMMPHYPPQSTNTSQQPQTIMTNHQPVMPAMPMSMPTTDPQSARVKGVAFSDNMEKKSAPLRQTSQTSSKISAVMASSASGTKGSKAGGTANAVGGKALAKKSSDLSSKSVGANSNRKQSQAPKKSDASKKKT